MKVVLCGVLGLALFAALRPIAPRYVALAEIEPSSFGASSYFENSCARCHGQEGANYSVQSLKKHTPQSLKTVVHDMAQGPGQAPLDESQLEIVTSWHRAFIAGEPWLQITKIERGTETLLSGEASSNAQISVQSGDKTIEAKRDGLKWSVALPADADTQHLQVLAVRGESKTALKLEESWFSHSQ